MDHFLWHEGEILRMLRHEISLKGSHSLEFPWLLDLLTCLERICLQFELVSLPGADKEFFAILAKLMVKGPNQFPGLLPILSSDYELLRDLYKECPLVVVQSLLERMKRDTECPPQLFILLEKAMSVPGSKADPYGYFISCSRVQGFNSLIFEICWSRILELSGCEDSATNLPAMVQRCLDQQIGAIIEPLHCYSRSWPNVPLLRT